MDVLARLEERFQEMTHKIKSMESEIQQLKEELESERANKQAVQERIERLLNTVQEEIT